MYQLLSEKITVSLIKKNIIHYADRKIYEYSIEVLLSDVVYFLVAALTAIFTNSILASIVFLISFFSIRKFAGGYHADTYLRCHIISWVNQILMVLLYKIVPTIFLKPLTLFFILTGTIFIFLFAPVENKNKPLSVKEKEKYAVMSKLIVAFAAIMVIVLSFTNTAFRYMSIAVFGIFSVSISLVAEKIKNHKKGEKENDKERADN